METVGEKMLTVKQAADMLGLTESAVRRWVLMRRISSYRVGRSVRIAESEIARILRQGFIPAREK